MAASKHLSRLRVVIDASDPCEILVICHDRHPERGPVLAWIREHAPKLVAQLETMGPIMFGPPANGVAGPPSDSGAYVVGWWLDTHGAPDLVRLADAMAARFEIVWRNRIAEGRTTHSVGTASLWIGDLEP